MWERFMRNMQCNVEFAYKLRIWSKTEENFGKNLWILSTTQLWVCLLNYSLLSGFQANKALDSTSTLFLNKTEDLRITEH